MRAWGYNTSRRNRIHRLQPRSSILSLDASSEHQGAVGVGPLRSINDFCTKFSALTEPLRNPQVLPNPLCMEDLLKISCHRVG